MTALLLTAALVAADPPKPSAEPKPVPATRLEVKEYLEGYKAARPRIPMPPPGEGRGVNNGRFREYYLPEMRAGGRGFSREPDPAMTLDNTFKVKLFWVTARANNCFY